MMLPDCGCGRALLCILSIAGDCLPNQHLLAFSHLDELVPVNAHVPLTRRLSTAIVSSRACAALGASQETKSLTRCFFTNTVHANKPDWDVRNHHPVPRQLAMIPKSAICLNDNVSM
jgi:hypothetical protein